LEELELRDVDTLLQEDHRSLVQCGVVDQSKRQRKEQQHERKEWEQAMETGQAGKGERV
jgi:hypothetical protein